MSTSSDKKKASAQAPAWGIVLAAGRADGFGADIDPVFLTMGSKPVLTYTLAAFERCPDVEGLVLVTSKERLESLRTMVSMFGCNSVKSIIAGPAAREGAVAAGLAVALENKAGIVTIHEGARPGVTPELIAETIRLARKHGAAAVARAVQDPACLSAKGVKYDEPVESGSVWATMTPQSFKTDVLGKALANAAKKKLHPLDEAAAVSANRGEVALVPSAKPLIRIAAPLDLNLAEFLLRH